MLPDDLNYPSNFFHANEIILTISGLEGPRNGASLTRKCLYYAYALSLYGTSITFFVLEIVKLQDTVKDSTKFFSHIGLLFTHLVGILKACLLLARSSRIRKVMDLLQDEKCWYETVDDFQPGLVLRRAKRRSSSVSILVSTECRNHNILPLLPHICNRRKFYTHFIHYLRHICSPKYLVFINRIITFITSIIIRFTVYPTFIASHINIG